MPLRFVLWISVVSLIATPTLGEMYGEEGLALTDRCQTLPDYQAPDADGNPVDRKSMAETLEDCQGVLKPPMEGDSEMIEPAPDVGDTPLVRPHDIPEQQGAE